LLPRLLQPKFDDVATAVIFGIAPWFSSAAGIASAPVRDRVVGYSHLIRLPKPCDTTHFVRHCADEAIFAMRRTRGG
jgi:hypothetical protein